MYIRDGDCAKDQGDEDLYIYNMECASVDRKRGTACSQKRLHVDLIHAQNSADLGIEACVGPLATPILRSGQTHQILGLA